jgi:hypothetical protein
MYSNGTHRLPPWEVSGSANLFRANIPALPQAVSLLNTQLVGTGVVPLTAGTLNLLGADLEIQRNVCPWLGFQLSISGATEGLNISIPTADASVFPTGSIFHALPEIFTGVFGPVITIRRSEHVQPWLRLMGGESRADIVPNSLFKADVRSSLNTFSFADTTATVDGGFGVDLLVTQSLSLKLGADVIGTWLFGAQQDQLRVSAGIVWRFGHAREKFDASLYE